MGTYLTTTALYIQMVDTTQDTATTALLADCMADAEAEVLKRLSERYDTSSDYFQDPAQTPPQVVALVKWLAIGYAYDALSRGGKDAFMRSDRYIKRATDNLTAILKGEANLVDQDGEIIDALAGGNEVYGNTTNYHDTFDEGNPLNWGPDKDKLADIIDSKE